MNNFLSIVWYRVLPPVYGGQKGIARFNDYLGKKVRLTCLCARSNRIAEKLSYDVVNTLPSSKWQFWNPLVRRSIRSFIGQQQFSHIIIEHPWHAWLGKYKTRFGFRFIVHAHNIEHQRLQAKHQSGWRFLKQIEKKSFERADHILFKTDEDRQTALALFTIDSAKCLVVPYGIEETSPPLIDPSARNTLRRRLHIEPDEKMLLFAGSLNYEPNARAIASITDHIIPLLQKKGLHFHLVICGELSEAKQSELNSIAGVTAAGLVSTMEDYLRAADVFINPVLTGSGIQTKNMDAIANGCNVVATSFAANGLPAYLDQKKLFIAADNDWISFTDNVIAASAHSPNTPQQFYDDYNWEKVIERMLAQILE